MDLFLISVIQQLNLTLGDQVRDTIIKSGIKAAEESGYTSGNTTKKLVEVAAGIGNSIDFRTKLVGGGVCTGLCAVSRVCETIAIGCSLIKIIPFRGNIYVCAKIVSKGCMTYRNICAGEGC